MVAAKTERHKEYNREWKDRNREKHRKQSRDHKRKLYETNKQHVLDMFGDACMECGNTYPFYVYDLHHANPETKIFQPRLANNKWEDLKKEVEKCILVCANCHREIHWK